MIALLLHSRSSSMLPPEGVPSYCLHNDYWCDDEEDCTDESDEASCSDSGGRQVAAHLLLGRVEYYKTFGSVIPLFFFGSDIIHKQKHNRIGILLRFGKYACHAFTFVKLFNVKVSGLSSFLN